jgi:hypothetical protein
VRKHELLLDHGVEWRQLAVQEVEQVVVEGALAGTLQLDGAHPAGVHDDSLEQRAQRVVHLHGARPPVLTSSRSLPRWVRIAIISGGACRKPSSS